MQAIGAKLVRQAAQRTNDQAGDGTTTATVLSAAFITEGMKIVAAGANPVQISRGMDKTVAGLVQKLKGMSKVSVCRHLLVVELGLGFQGDCWLFSPVEVVQVRVSSDGQMILG